MSIHETREVELTRAEWMLIKAIRRKESLPEDVDYASIERWEDTDREFMLDVSFYRTQQTKQ